jgi:hypothetical protein
VRAKYGIGYEFTSGFIEKLEIEFKSVKYFLAPLYISTKRNGFPDGNGFTDSWFMNGMLRNKIATQFFLYFSHKIE